VIESIFICSIAIFPSASAVVYHLSFSLFRWGADIPL